MSVANPVAILRGFSVTIESGHGSAAAVSDVDLEVGRGEIVALVGESGSGKTVLSSSLLGAVPRARRVHRSGSLIVTGVDLMTAAPAELRDLRAQRWGAVFQQPMSAMNPSMRIGRQLTERDPDRQRAVLALDETGVPEPEQRMHQWPHELSGGLQQRVMIAMATLAAGGRSPELLVADEPTTALDVRVQAQILRLFTRLRDEHHCAVLLVTHDLGVAATVADRVVVMSHGRIVESGVTQGVLTSPTHKYTAGLLADRKRLSTPGARPATVDRSSNAIEVRNLVKRYRRAGAPAVDDVSFSVPRHGSVAIVGESGSGKTTLLRTICGLLRPDSGEIITAGKHGPELIYQDAGGSLTPWLRIGDQIGERLRKSGTPRAEVAGAVAGLLEDVGLDPALSGRRPRELSGGQRQRVAIARALASRPEVLACDEPVSALDASLALKVLDLFAELRARHGVALLMVTHDLDAARYLADDVVVMLRGRVAEAGPIGRVLTDPRDEYTRELLDACPTIESALALRAGS
jgi:peptide/nickel transport system ATP-binding protein